MRVRLGRAPAAIAARSSAERTPPEPVARREQCLEVVGGVKVVQGQSVAVLPQGRAGFRVPKDLLGLEQVSVGDQDGGDGVPQRVQAHPGMSVGVDDGARTTGRAGRCAAGCCCRPAT